jgi:hypothetical protein
MIRNVSYNNKEIKQEINDKVGRPFTMMERFRMGGNGSPKFVIHDASDDIMELLGKDRYINYCNIELRPEGIMVGFRSILESYAWVVPFQDLRLFYQNGQLSIFSNENFVEINDKKNRGPVFEFALKMQAAKEIVLEDEVLPRA